MTKTVLQVQGLSKTYRTGWWKKQYQTVLRQVSFSLQEGEVLGLAGVSGAGKSTLLRILAGLTEADGGEILLQGASLTEGTEKERRARRGSMQLLFQNTISSLNPRMTIRQSVLEPLLIHHRSLSVDWPRFLAQMQLRSELLDRYPAQLSGGELQRVCLGRLLLLQPQVLLLDEPTSMLDVSVQAQIISILQEARTESNLSCLFISHDLDLLHACCDRIGILQEGTLIELQDAASLYAHPQQEYTKQFIAAFTEF